MTGRCWLSPAPRARGLTRPFVLLPVLLASCGLESIQSCLQFRSLWHLRKLLQLPSLSPDSVPKWYTFALRIWTVFCDFHSIAVLNVLFNPCDTVEQVLCLLCTQANGSSEMAGEPWPSDAGPVWSGTAKWAARWVSKIPSPHLLLHPVSQPAEEIYAQYTFALYRSARVTCLRSIGPFRTLT